MGSTFLKVGLFALYLNGAMAAAVEGILEQHNNYRCMHGADDLTYSTSLQADAQVHADYLTETCYKFEHATDLTDGENLATCAYIGTVDAACDAGSTATPLWYDEEQFYVPGATGTSNTAGEAIGHFTQVVWKSTTQVGCASAACEHPYTGDSAFFAGQNWQRTIVVCRYSEPGNFEGEYLANVEATPTSTLEACAADTPTTCTNDMDCTVVGEICCPTKLVCEVPVSTGACGDPHMTGFHGQKFDFTGEDGAWYAVVSDLPNLHLNMRVTSPVPSVPEITYITGISIKTTDADGLDHTIVISVTDPHDLGSDCPVGVSPCLAAGSLTVELDGAEELFAPGEVTLGPDVAISAVNLPGACRSFGFEKYWEYKQLENAAQAGRRLASETQSLRSMADWILDDPTATNMVECAEYVARAEVAGNGGLFDHQSEHASFQIVTPAAAIRLSHGMLHQLPIRDPTDRFDLPDHVTWQMNLAINHNDVSLEATGVLGETLVPTIDDNFKPIMQGMESIRGTEEDYRVEGPLEIIFSQNKHHQ